MKLNVAKKLIESHLMEGEMRPGKKVGVRIVPVPNADAETVSS